MDRSVAARPRSGYAETTLCRPSIPVIISAGVVDTCLPGQQAAATEVETTATLKRHCHSLVGCGNPAAHATPAGRRASRLTRRPPSQAVASDDDRYGNCPIRRLTGGPRREPPAHWGRPAAARVAARGAGHLITHGGEVRLCDKPDSGIRVEANATPPTLRSTPRPTAPFADEALSQKSSIVRSRSRRVVPSRLGPRVNASASPHFLWTCARCAPQASACQLSAARLQLNRSDHRTWLVKA